MPSTAFDSDPQVWKRGGDTYESASAPIKGPTPFLRLVAL